MPYRDRDAESFFAQAAKDSPSRPAMHMQELPPIPPSLLRRDPDPPTEDYLRIRARLGMESHARSIMVPCPWCKAGILQQCWNPGTRAHCDPHPSRRELAADAGYTDAARRELAALQVAESRRQRLAFLDGNGR